MFPGGRLHDDKQDLFSVGCDDQEQILEDRDVSGFQKTLFSRIHELNAIHRQKVPFSEDHASQNSAPELSGGHGTQQNVQELLTGGSSSQSWHRDIFQREQATKHGLFPEGRSCEDQDVLPEGSVAILHDENVFSEDDSSQQTLLSEPCVNQPYDELRVPEFRDDESSAEDTVSGTRDDQNTFPTDHVTRRMEQNVLTASLADERCILSEAHSTRAECLLEQGAFAGGRLTQRLDTRTAPRQLDMDLDLDYLERRREHAREPRGPPPETEASPDSMDLVKVILLGAPAVGKTSIIQQFVWNDFSENYVPTDRKHTYYPSVIINEHLYELKISDIPVIPYFPVNSFYEWTDYRFYGLRSATAYVLVFDLSNADTFQYIRNLRDQMLESRDMRNVPLLVVGNKQDLLVSSAATGGGSGGNGAAGGSGTSGSGGATTAIAGTSSGRDVEYREKRRDIVNLVKKHWKCTYVECSAKYNWRVVAVFKELMKAVDSLETGQGGKEVCSPMMDNLHDALDRNKCNIL